MGTAVNIQNPEIIGPRLIGLCGDAGAGKSTAAAILEAQGYERLRFAGPIKAMIAALLTSAGMTEAEAHRRTDGDLKEVGLNQLCGLSARCAMQTIGTEWGRQLVHENLWLGVTMGRAEALLAEGKRVVIDDVRFRNEAGAVQGPELHHMRGLREVWRVEGRGGITGGHASEGQYLGHDLALDNSTSPEALEAQILAEILD